MTIRYYEKSLPIKMSQTKILWTIVKYTKIGLIHFFSPKIIFVKLEILKRVEKIRNTRILKKNLNWWIPKEVKNWKLTFGKSQKKSSWRWKDLKIWKLCHKNCTM